MACRNCQPCKMSSESSVRADSGGLAPTQAHILLDSTLLNHSVSTLEFYINFQSIPDEMAGSGQTSPDKVTWLEQELLLCCLRSEGYVREHFSEIWSCELAQSIGFSGGGKYGVLKQPLLFLQFYLDSDFEICLWHEFGHSHWLCCKTNLLLRSFL